ncbi:MAG: nickel pincer cofactor biosynthesis protein LarC [Candidatus Thorarchaeota archaeon]
MAKKTVLIDAATAGASGDMFLSALIDLIGEDDVVVPVAASLLIYDPSLRVKVVHASFEDLTGKQLEITGDKRVHLTPQSLLEIMQVVNEELELSKTAADFASKALNVIMRAESKAHDQPISEVHLHELGTVDTILDLVGTAYLLEKANLLGKAKFLATSVAVGTGTIKTEHGELAVPVPAVKAILDEHSIPYHPGSGPTETLTPTGAAILAVLVDEYVDSSEGFKTEREVIGFGTRKFGDFPNALRLRIGEPQPTKTSPKAPSKVPKEEPQTKTPAKKAEEMTITMDGWETDEVVVLETNVDDVDGEILGNLFDTLTSDNLALDVVMIPAFGKKNRPCTVVKVISQRSNLDTVASILIRHLGALGIRYTTWQRIKASRETIVCKMDIDGREFMVRVKVSRSDDGSVVNIKPEADDIMKVAKVTGIPIRELKPRIILQAHAITE